MTLWVRGSREHGFLPKEKGRVSLVAKNGGRRLKYSLLGCGTELRWFLFPVPVFLLLLLLLSFVSLLSFANRVRILVS